MNTISVSSTEDVASADRSWNQISGHEIEIDFVNMNFIWPVSTCCRECVSLSSLKLTPSSYHKKKINVGVHPASSTRHRSTSNIYFSGSQKMFCIILVILGLFVVVYEGSLAMLIQREWAKVNQEEHPPQIFSCMVPALILGTGFVLLHCTRKYLCSWGLYFTSTGVTWTDQYFLGFAPC